MPLARGAKLNLRSFMKYLVVIFIIFSANTFACSKGLIDNLANKIEGDYSSSIRSIKVAVASTKACARNSQMMAYAAHKFSSRLRGDYSYAVKGSQELAKLCIKDFYCANALILGIASRIRGDYSYSVGMTKAIAEIVRRNPYYDVQCNALEQITYAMRTDYSYSIGMQNIMMEISDMRVKD